MKTFLIAAATAFALSGGVALAQTAGGTGTGSGGNGAVGNQTTTSMGAPESSPGYQAPRSQAVPGLSNETRMAQQENAAGQHTNQGVANPVEGPKNPVTGHTQVTR